jgi:BCD family chlorophyll transporter-like MFS transporter
VDAGRHYYGADGPAFETVFAVEAVMFMVAALLALRLNADNKSTIHGKAIA